ncbi:MAG TPA: peptidase M23 [Thiotrichales bacterium]|nr:peptidase M23 [Thiotrichales bacterium]
MIGHDYKHLRQADRPVRRRLRHGHVLAVGMLAGASALLMGILPEQADAVRAGPAEIGAVTVEPLSLPPLTEAQTIPLEPTTEEEGDDWREITVRSGDSLARIFSREGLSASELHRIMALGKPVRRLRNLRPGDRIRLRGSNGAVAELVLEEDEARHLRVWREEESYRAERVSLPVERRIGHASGIIHDSLFLAGQQAGLSDTLIMELAQIFGWDIDFALDIREGDRFTVLYEELWLEGRKLRDGRIVAAEFVNRGHTYRAVRFRGPEGDDRFYTPEGRSLRKSFLRTPVEFSRISSRFSLGRRHPILNRIRAHKGVDYAAPRGTPVRATGDGKVEFRGTKGGYGRTIVLRHAGRYTTLYAHLNGYHRKVRKGARVKQGQIIGYVGSSGLATGPHLHYEFRVDGVHRNPLTVRLPAAQPLASTRLSAFQAQATPLLAQLEALDRVLVADRGTP